jgi:uncharacterized protein
VVRAAAVAHRLVAMTTTVGHTREIGIEDRVNAVDWTSVSDHLDAYGWGLLEKILTADECRAIAGLYDDGTRFRSHIVMARHGFGRGEYKYFSYPLPDMVADLRAALYRRLAALANRWNESMGIDVRFPAAHAAFIERCHKSGQTRPTPLLLRYGTGDYNCLHQDLYGEHIFPFQVAFLLAEPEKDFTGGEFVLTEHGPACSPAPRWCRSAVVTASSSPCTTAQCRVRAGSIGSICGTASAVCAPAAATPSA